MPAPDKGIPTLDHSRRQRRRTGVLCWTYGAGGCWVGTAYWAMWGWVGAVVIASVETFLALILLAFVLGTEAGDD